MIPRGKQVEVTNSMGIRQVALLDFVGWNLMDLLTTDRGLSAGIPEANPVPAMLLGNGGEAMMYAAKVVVSLLLVAAVLLLPRFRRLWYAVDAASVVLAVAVISNITHIMR